MEFKPGVAIHGHGAERLNECEITLQPGPEFFQEVFGEGRMDADQSNSFSSIDLKAHHKHSIKWQMLRVWLSPGTCFDQSIKSQRIYHV